MSTARFHAADDASYDKVRDYVASFETGSAAGGARSDDSISLKRLLFGTLRRQLTAGMAAMVALMMTLFVLDMTQPAAGHCCWSSSPSRRPRWRKASPRRRRSGSPPATSAGLQEIVDGLARYPDLRYAIVLDPHGQVLAHSE